MSGSENYVIGVDFGSDSVRALVVDAFSGKTVSTGVCAYPRWKAGRYQHPELSVFRQHPQDYIDAFTSCVREALSCLTQEQRRCVRGIGFDTTGSTPTPVNREGTPLALTEKYADDENAMFWLWKDHSSYKEAEEIDRAFTGGAVNYDRYQGKYSAEWFWAKILHAIRVAPYLREDAYTWVEHQDWMVGLLTGNTRPETMYHGACGAGHKAYWHSAWHGLPDGETLGKVDPYLRQVHDRYGRAPQPADVCCGRITPSWAARLDVPEETVISGASFDAHAGAVGAGIREKTMICTIGTSAVDMIVAKPEDLEGKDISHFGGQAENSILPGYVGIETGQAAFGDIFAWFKRLLMWPVQKTLAEERRGDGPEGTEEAARKALEKASDQMLLWLEKEASALPDDVFPISLDWFNGRRYPDTDDFQRGVISGLSLGSTAPMIYRSLVFAAVCGLNRICRGFTDAGIQIDRIRAVGGISKKSPFVMQMMADVLGKDVEVLDSDQTCALGAAMYASAAGGCAEDMADAARHMAARTVMIYHPDQKHDFYTKKYEEYLTLAERFT